MDSFLVNVTSAPLEFTVNITSAPQEFTVNVTEGIALKLGTATNGLALATDTLTLGTASTSTTGALTSTDWNTFDSKENAIGYTPANDNAVVHLTGNETVAGNKTLSGQTELTNQAATNGTSVLTRNLAAAERLLAAPYLEWDPYGANLGHSQGGNNGTGSWGNLNTLNTGSAVGGWGRSVISQITTRSAGAGVTSGLCSVPLAVALVGSFTVDNTSSVLRLIVGDAISGTPATSAAASLTARGFGVQWFMVGTQVKVCLFAHNGTTLTSGAEVNWAGNWSGQGMVIVASDGVGNIKLFMAGSDTHAALSRPVEATACRISGGPTDRIYGMSGTSTVVNGGAVTIVGTGDGSAVPGAKWHHMRGRIILGTVL
jgi:hypothetical protein